MRAYIKISYDGSKYFGFQQQHSSKPTIANNLQEVFMKLGINFKFEASGRTDKGVHANGQILHVDLPKFWNDLNKLKIILNRHLNPSIHVKKICLVQDDFHARFWAVKREYRYIFCHDKFSPFLADYCIFYHDFDIEKLNDILSIFKGKHDFEYFKKNGSDTKNYIREIYKIKAIKHKNKTIICIQANGFLRSQIRMIISAVLKVYENKLSKNQLLEQLNKSQIYTQTLALPNALYLHRIFYDKKIYIKIK